MNKKQLLENLKNNTYCRLKNSKIEGIGVIAVKNIPKGTNPFIGSCNHQYIKITKKEIEKLDAPIKEIIKDFFINSKSYALIPTCSFNGIDISFYMNHSKTPNIKTDKYGEKFEAIKEIEKGEELTINYENYNEKFSKHP